MEQKSVGFLRMKVLRKRQSKTHWKTRKLKGLCSEEQLKLKKIKRENHMLREDQIL